VTCCFITDEKVFINLFYNPTLTHYHFIWDVTKKSIVGKPVQLKMECSKKNFPYKCFYNEDKHEIYSFYRQGFSFIIDADDCSKYVFDRMTDMDLGQMYLVYNQALIARSSSDILFFKLDYDENSETRKWR
jgi:hypothetical protein